MESTIKSSAPEGFGQDLGYSPQTTYQEMLSQAKRMTGNNPHEINPNAPQTGNNPNEINPNAPQTGTNPDEMNPNTPQRENTPNEINPNIPQTGNDPNEITPIAPQRAEYQDDTRQERELRLPETAGEKKEGYAETPSEEYIPEINGNEKYQSNYQDSEEPSITE